MALSHQLHAQFFQLVTDSLNPLVTEPDCGAENNWSNNCFQGAAWGNLNQDQCLDLIYAGKVFINDCNGSFTKTNGLDLSGFATRSSSVSLMDFDNDKDLDLLFFNGGGYGTKVFKNDGQANFTLFNTILDSINSTVWSAQWCDYNLDAYADIILTFADGFAGNLHFPNRLFSGSANGNFQAYPDTLEFLSDLHPYTVSYWIDYDEDGDQDLFIASGPASQTAPDFLYKNELKETGLAYFTKITSLSFAGEAQNGQCYNFIDIDGDADLDACLTNWRIVPNRLYQNNNGNYITVNSSFTTNANSFSLSNAWGDLDNDGDLDVLITSNQPSEAQYYLNDGQGNFTVGGSIGTILNGPTSGISLGDYSNDGRLDFFVTGREKGLFRNTVSNSNTFLLLNLIGNPNHRSPVGARVHLKCVLNGSPVWLKREVSAQNTFMGQNSTRVHFGLGDATLIDSLVIYWPSGAIGTYENLAPAQLYLLEEGSPPQSEPLNTKTIKSPRTGFKVYPVPSDHSLEIKLEQEEANHFVVKLLAANGCVIKEKLATDTQRCTLDVKKVPSGNYILNLLVNGAYFTKTVIIQ
jgi:hypothetical protein